MKRYISILIALSLLLTLCACGRKKKEEIGVLRIGVLEPMSGKYAAQGMRETLGVQYANTLNDTLKLKNKTYRVELVILDNASDPQRAAECAQELVDAGCSVVIGSYGAELSKAASDVFLRAGVPAIAASCDDPSVTTGNDHYFRIGPLPDLQGSVLANYSKRNLYAKSACCLVQSGSELDAALMSAFRSEAEGMGMKVNVVEFPAGTVDFEPYFTMIMEGNPHVIFAPCALANALLIIEQATGQKDLPPIMADARWRSAATLKALEDTGITLYIAAAYTEGANSSFDAEFKEWLRTTEGALAYNGESDVIYPESVLGYDAYLTALSAAELSGSADRADILAILPTVMRDGVSGTCSFDEDGGAVRSAMWIEKANAKNGTWDYAYYTRLH